MMNTGESERTIWRVRGEAFLGRWTRRQVRVMMERRATHVIVCCGLGEGRVRVMDCCCVDAVGWAACAQVVIGRKVDMFVSLVCDWRWCNSSHTYVSAASRSESLGQLSLSCMLVLLLDLISLSFIG